MKGFKKLIRDCLPSFIGDVIFSFYNRNLYKVRHSGKYKFWREYYKKFSCADADSLSYEQTVRLQKFLLYCCSYSKYYKKLLDGIDINSFGTNKIGSLPMLDKEFLREHVLEIATVDPLKAIVSMTGGTTGNSMTVYYDPEDIQERFAFIDEFRSQFGYELGKRIAWCSGKEILSPLDIKSHRFYKNDLINKIRFFSTFHLNQHTFIDYWTAFKSFKPEYILGFPSFVYDLCLYANKAGEKYDGIIAYFPTAETVNQEHRVLIQKVLGCKIVDQYASSEGAPFITQCKAGNYHIQPHTGVFEILDEHHQPTISGELVVTSFSTRGTPLIRYRVGDSITLSDSDQTCSCGFGGQILKRLDGRKADFVTTPDGRKISSVNFSNSTKEILGIVAFQVHQNSLDTIKIFVVGDNLFDERQEAYFVAAIRERVGNEIKIDIQRVTNILREKSGKFRVVKSTLI